MTKFTVILTLLIMGNISTDAGDLCKRYSIIFNFDSYSITGNNQNVIEEVLQLLNQGKYYIELSGHTDSIGSDTYNYKLAQKRINTVRKELSRSEFDHQFVEYNRGSMLAKVNRIDRARFSNRRVEISLWPMSGKYLVHRVNSQVRILLSPSIFKGCEDICHQANRTYFSGNLEKSFSLRFHFDCQRRHQDCDTAIIEIKSDKDSLFVGQQDSSRIYSTYNKAEHKHQIIIPCFTFRPIIFECGFRPLYCETYLRTEYENHSTLLTNKKDSFSTRFFKEFTQHPCDSNLVVKSIAYENGKHHFANKILDELKEVEGRNYDYFLIKKADYSLATSDTVVIIKTCWLRNMDIAGLYVHDMSEFIPFAFVRKNKFIGHKITLPVSYALWKNYKIYVVPEDQVKIRYNKRKNQYRVLIRKRSIKDVEPITNKSRIKY